tara:strand:+ start:74 stop:559 length:486 start_codon:yes stop_codon:yes gene_type:complete
MSSLLRAAPRLVATGASRWYSSASMSEGAQKIGELRLMTAIKTPYTASGEVRLAASVPLSQSRWRSVLLIARCCGHASHRPLVSLPPPHSRFQVDLDAFDVHCEHQIANGVEALIIGGTTGEGHLFSWEEHIMVRCVALALLCFALLACLFDRFVNNRVVA